MEQEPGLYEHEVLWLGKAMEDQAAVAHDMRNALDEALAKLDKGDTNIKSQLREMVAYTSYLEGSSQRIKEYYPLRPEDMPDPRPVVQPNKLPWYKRI